MKCKLEMLKMVTNPFQSKKGRKLYEELINSSNSSPESNKIGQNVVRFEDLQSENLHNKQKQAQTAYPEDNNHTEMNEIIKVEKINKNIFINDPNYKPSIEDLILYYKAKGVVGEESNSVLQTFCAVNGLSFGVEGYSGSGKTFLVDKLISLLPQYEIYRIGLSSDLAILNDAAKINGKKFIYIPEIQKAMKKKDAPIIEVIKNLTEGKDAERIVTVEQGKTISYKIKSGITVIYTLALENDFKKDDETARRFITLTTDSSKKHIDEILEYKAKSRVFFDATSITSAEEENLKQHLYQCINSSFSYKDPFAVYMNRHIPPTQKTVGFIEHYYGLLNGCAKFHNKSREKSGKDIFLDIQDHIIIHQLYHDEFCKTIKRISKNGDCSELIEKAKENVNWAECLRHATSIMNENFPEFSNVWREKQIAYLENKATVNRIDVLGYDNSENFQI